jgi:hypothetical protein
VSHNWRLQGLQFCHRTSHYQATLQTSICGNVATEEKSSNSNLEGARSFAVVTETKWYN